MRSGRKNDRTPRGLFWLSVLPVHDPPVCQGPSCPTIPYSDRSTYFNRVDMILGWHFVSLAWILVSIITLRYSCSSSSCRATSSKTQGDALGSGGGGGDDDAMTCPSTGHSFAMHDLEGMLVVFLSVVLVPFQPHISLYCTWSLVFTQGRY